MTEPGKNKILIVDDEFHNIDDLELAIDCAFAVMKYRGIREYAAHPEEAVEKMIRSMQEGEKYAAIISDNHMGDTICGDDFFKLVRGHLAYCFSESFEEEVDLRRYRSFADIQREVLGHANTDDQILSFLEENFRHIEEYRNFVNHHFEARLIILCGIPNGLNLGPLEGRIDVFKKPSHAVKKGERYLCEKAVMLCLAGHGIFPIDAVEKSFEYHPRLANGVHPNRQIYREKR